MKWIIVLVLICAQVSGKTLKEEVFLGSHDAGMYLPNIQSRWINTQSLTILEQLRVGARYFDLRPIYYREKLYTGHYAGTSYGTPLGGNGDLLANIFDQVDQFLQETDSKELIILKFSHYLNWSMVPFSDREKGMLIDELKSRLGEWLFINRTEKRLCDLSIKEITGGRSRVIPLFEGGVSDCEEGLYSYADYGEEGDLIVFDQYANTDSLSTLIDDQWTKFKAVDEALFDLHLLSWTLTMQNFSPLSTSLKKLGLRANELLIPQLIYANRKMNEKKFPHIIYVDQVKEPISEALRIARDEIDSPLLVASYKGGYGRRLHLCFFFNNRWYGNQYLSSFEYLSNYGPCAVKFVDDLRILYANNEDNDRFYQIVWNGNRVIAHEECALMHRPTNTPFATVHNDQIYLIFKSGDCIFLARSCNTGENWSEIPLAIQATDTPRLASFGEQLYVVWQDGGICVASLNALEQPQKIIACTSKAPSVCVFRNSLHIVYADLSGRLYEAVWDGECLQNDPIEIPNQKCPLSTDTPSLAVYDDRLHLVYKGALSGKLYHAWKDEQGVWRGNQKLKTAFLGDTAATSAPCSLTVY